MDRKQLEKRWSYAKSQSSTMKRISSGLCAGTSHFPVSRSALTSFSMRETALSDQK